MVASDADLLKQMAAGEQAAFASFYDRHAARTFGLLLRMLRHRAEAEDVLQEVFWEVWKRAGDYDAERATAAAWLALIARSRAVDQLRRRKPAARRGPSRDIR